MAARISIIIPTFNRAAYLSEALESILSQVTDADEILLVDDGSTDRTCEIAARYAPRVRYVRQDNAGKAVALNRGLELTDGEFVWICDDDDVLLPGSLTALVDRMESSGADFVFGRYYPFQAGTDGTWERLEFHWPGLHQGSVTRHLLEDAFIMQNAALVRRGCYQRVGPFDVTMLRSVDYEMFVRLALAFPPSFVDREIFAQRKHPGARGPSSMLHAAGQSEKIWLEFDQRIFRRLHADVPEFVFSSMFDAVDTMIQRRAGLLQRACIMARHALWDLAIADIDAAARLMPERSLDPMEQQICGRMLSGKYDMAGTHDPDVVAMLRACHRAGGLQRQIVIQILRGGIFRLRRRSGQDVRNILALIHNVCGPLGYVEQALADIARRGPKVATVYEQQPHCHTLPLAPCPSLSRSIG
jgi:glycosyltransferase involved in cell wall biosynthesis